MPPEGLPHQGKLLVVALGPDSDGDVLVLQLTVNLLDETGIMGEDVVVILKAEEVGITLVKPKSNKWRSTSGRRFCSNDSQDSIWPGLN